MEVRFGGDRRLVFDAGSGLRLLGLARTGPLEQEIVFLTHFHWDHIQGFPFFPPLYRTTTPLHIVAPTQETLDVRSLFAGQLGPVYFPVPFKEVSAHIVFHHLNDGVWEGDGYKITALRVRHPSFTVGYKIEVGGRVVTYIPDNELVGGSYDMPDNWEADFRRFVRGSDVLIHDAMFTAEEYQKREGWGHSTFEQAVQLALQTGVPRLIFFHHSPERSDADLTRIVEETRTRLRDGGHTLEVEAACEGGELMLTPAS